VQAGETCQSSGDIVSSRFGADLVGAFGLGRFGVYAQLPVVLYQGSDFDTEMSELSVTSIGDLRLGGKALIAESGGSAFAFDLRGLVPTSQGDDFTGDGGTTIEGRGIYEFRRQQVSLGAHVGYAWRQKASRIANLYVDDEVLWSVGGEYAFTPRVSAGVAVFGRIGVMSDPDVMGDNGSPSYEERPAEAMASTRIWAMPNLAVEAGAGVGILDGYGAPAYRALLAVRYSQQAPADLDWDRDRILNVDDSCPRVPEDWDNFSDEDGCPELDNDKDKIVDTKDACPNEPEDVDAFEDENGCPDPDNDKDGILDASDKCPNDPEDKDAFEDEDGCPDLDNDKDGILDPQDKCPNDPEDKDGFEDDDGCPDPDNDKDGLLDNVDKCPDQPETYNGIDDADGCPDAAPTVVVTNQKVEIKETVYFDLNKATIKPISFKLLDGVAAALAAHSTLKIAVEGHTDDRAADDYNLKLSQRRAEAVREYLIKKGIDAARLTAIGYGESRPAVKGTSNEARDQNRRVEFIIVNPPAAPGTTPAPAPSGSSPLPAPGPVTKP
jgi:outer membrane protein OmpA-like peptidoglycan-associated protein